MYYKITITGAYDFINRDFYFRKYPTLEFLKKEILNRSVLHTLKQVKEWPPETAEHIEIIVGVILGKKLIITITPFSFLEGI